jgi:hypothetical protein
LHKQKLREKGERRAKKGGRREKLMVFELMVESGKKTGNPLCKREADGVGTVNYRSRRSLVSGGNVPTRLSKRTLLLSGAVHLKPVR